MQWFEWIEQNIYTDWSEWVWNSSGLIPALPENPLRKLFLGVNFEKKLAMLKTNYQVLIKNNPITGWFDYFGESFHQQFYQSFGTESLSWGDYYRKIAELYAKIDKSETLNHKRIYNWTMVNRDYVDSFFWYYYIICELLKRVYNKFKKDEVLIQQFNDTELGNIELLFWNLLIRNLVINKLALWWDVDLPNDILFSIISDWNTHVYAFDKKNGFVCFQVADDKKNFWKQTIVKTDKQLLPALGLLVKHWFVD